MQPASHCLSRLGAIFSAWEDLAARAGLPIHIDLHRELHVRLKGRARALRIHPSMQPWARSARCVARMQAHCLLAACTRHAPGCMGG